jgi:hypothetical protein
MVIIIVLKLDLKINPIQGSDHGLGGSTRLTQYFIKNNQIKQPCFDPFFFQKINGFFTHVLCWTDYDFLSDQVMSITSLFFLKLGPIQPLSQPVKSVLVL